MVLPKLKSIDLRYHQIKLKQPLSFCSERKDDLESVRLFNILDVEDGLNMIMLRIEFDMH